MRNFKNKEDQEQDSRYVTVPKKDITFFGQKSEHLSYQAMNHLWIFTLNFRFIQVGSDANFIISILGTLICESLTNYFNTV